MLQSALALIILRVFCARFRRRRRPLDDTGPVSVDLAAPAALVALGLALATAAAAVLELLLGGWPPPASCRCGRLMAGWSPPGCAGLPPAASSAATGAALGAVGSGVSAYKKRQRICSRVRYEGGEALVCCIASSTPTTRRTHRNACHPITTHRRTLRRTMLGVTPDNAARPSRRHVTTKGASTRSPRLIGPIVDDDILHVGGSLLQHGYELTMPQRLE